MAKTYNVQEVQQRLAKHIEGMIDRVAGDIQDLVKREKIKKSLWATAHEEPGTHEAGSPGDQPHMEPGGHEQFELNPPATPDAATAAPIHGGNGVPPGALDNPATGAADPAQEQMHAMLMGDGPCPLCQQPEQNCKCLDAMILGKSMGKLPDGSGFMTGTVKMEKNASMGYGSAAGSAGAPPPAAAGSSLAMSEMCSIEKCSEGLTPHAAHDPAKKSELDGRNGDPTKKQPTAPVDGAKMPPENGGKSMKSADGKKPKANPLGKTLDTSKPDSPSPGPSDSEPAENKCHYCGAHSMSGICDKCYDKQNPGVKKGDVPQAKPPSGKVPGGTSNPPMASTTSKPGVMKEEPLDKAVMNPQAQQHMNVDASKAAAPKPGPGAGGAPALTHPSNMARANTHAAALAGEFQPKGPVTSGLELAPKGLTAPPPAARMGATPAPKIAGMPKPMGVQPTVPPKGVHAGNAGFGSIFGKSEKCVLCRKDEHVGECK